jgi:aspartyl protease family protein
MFGLDEGQSMSLVYLIALIALIIAFRFFGLWRPPRNTSGGRFERAMQDPQAPRSSQMQHLLLWVAIVLALAVVYAYRTPLLRFAAPVLQELDPSRAIEVTTSDGQTELVIARGMDGHFHVDARANGAETRFLIDTGASGTVLTTSDAKRSGIDTGALDFDRPVDTANGLAYYAAARLDTLEIGPWRLVDVPIGVMPDRALSTSLLGMDTINRFASVRIEGDRLMIVP